MKILVAMSGGIDSSVVAHLLCEEGHEVIGVRFQLWQDPLAPSMAKVLPTKCCDTQSIARAHAVAKKLGITLHTVRLEIPFKRMIVDPFLAAYRRGLTPNPCVLCNRIFKFAELLKLADAFGCDKVSTGHYARIVVKEDENGNSYSALMEAKDKGKDQSYYLYRLSQEQLCRVLLPLGTKTKRSVYALAERYGIPLERMSYRESQDLCFFPEKSPSAFLRRYITAAKPGPIKTSDGTIIGRHDGLPFYTVGQRRGLKVGGQASPLYVLRKEQKNNTIIMAPIGAEKQSRATISDLTFTHAIPRKAQGRCCTARMRSFGEKLRGTFRWRGDHGVFSFEKSTPGLTPGQSLVLEDGEEILGGGIIDQP